MRASERERQADGMGALCAKDGGAPLRLAQAGDIDALAGVLARAFDRDPFINWLVRQDARRVPRMEWTFEVMLRRMSSELNETYTSAELGGAALWKRPGEFKLPVARQVGLVPAFVKATGWGRVPALLRLLHHLEAQHDRLVPEPHFYLLALGVDPVQQGRGLGSRLLAPVLARCDVEGMRAYLETARADNVLFYTRHGFELDGVVEREGWPKFWLMRREPRALAAPGA